MRPGLFILFDLPGSGGGSSRCGGAGNIEMLLSSSKHFLSVCALSENFAARHHKGG